MRNFTFRKSGFFRLFFLVIFLLSTYSASAQFYTKHYIAPAPWQYFNDANEIVIATNSTATVNITIKKSDGTLVTNLTAIKGTPAVYRFSGTPSTTKAYAFNTVLNAAGLIVEGNAPVSINLRNVASDALSGTDVDKDIKGNAALTSFGDAGLGVRFRIGYYRDGTLGNFNNYGDQRPIYSVMATVNNTTIKINNTVTTTLNAGQSYLFKAAIGTLVESSNPVVMNTSAAIDTPGGCGDSAYNQIPPEAVLGTEYFLERGTGNSTAEQTTVVATKDNTVVTVEGYSTTGALVTTNTVTLAQAGNFYTFVNGSTGTNFTASRIVADKRVAVYSGTAQGCEVDISTIAPVSECGGSNFIETAKFRNYGSGTLDYFGYILLRSATEVVTVNGADIATISGVGARYQIGTTGWYIINFNSVQIGSPNFLSIASNAKLTVSIVQQAGGFSMAGFFSNFAAQPEDPGLTYISGGGCTNNTAELTTPNGFAPYQWYYNGTAISGANSSTYTATKTGAYSVSSTLVCGSQTQSKAVNVTLCTDLGITKVVDNATPCLGSNVEFTVKVSNLGGNNVSGVSVTDLLPSGYTYVSSTPSVGVYDSGTGIWTIGDVEAQTSMTLKIVATVNATGNYTNTASFPSAIDTNTANNSASAAVTPKTGNLVITNPAAVCSPSTVDLTVPAITSGSSSNLILSYWTNSTATTSYTTPTSATAGTYYIKAVSSDGCTFIKPVVVTVNSLPTTPVINVNSGQASCTSSGNMVLRSAGNANSYNGSSYLWSNGETTRNITITSEGTYSLKIINSSGCASASSNSITVTFAPAAPTASSQTFCSSENKKVSDLVASGSSLKWYNSANGGTQYASTASLTSGTYYVTQTAANGCESERTAVTVTVNSTSSAPVASAQSFCAADNKKVSDLVAVGTNLKWYNASTNGTQYLGTETLVSGNYYVSQMANSCGESTRTLVVVTINAIPSAPTASSQTFCFAEAKKVSDLVASGSGLKWYNASTAGTLYTGTETLVTGTYYVSQSNSCGESTRRAVSVTVNNTVAPTASSQVFCATDNKKVSDLVASGANLKWYTASTGGSLYTGTEILSSGNYYVSQTLNSCESTRTLVAVTVNNTTAPTASSQTFCSSENKKVSDLAPSGTTYKWYNASTGGTSYSGTETLVSGNYYVSQILNSCESSRTLVAVTVNPTPAQPTITAGGATTFCSGGSVTLTSSNGYNYLWSNGATTQSITVTASGNYSVQVSEASGCKSISSAVTAVTVNAVPSAPTATAQTFCSADAKTVNDLVASGTSLKWYSASTNGTLYAGTETLATGTYYVSQTTNGCESSRTPVSVTVNTTPSASTATAQTFCSADAKTVNDLVASGTALKWYSASTNGTLYAGTETLATGTYYVSQTTNGCESTRTPVSVTVNTTPSAPTATAQTFCSADAKTVNDLVASGTSLKWYNASTNGTLYAGTEILATGTYYVSQTTNGCESTRTPVSVTVNTTPSAPTATAQTFCSADAKTVNDLVASGTSLKWYSASTNGTLYAGTEILATGTYYVSQTTNGCESSRTAVSVTVNTTPSAPTATAQTFCSADAKTVNDLVASGTSLKWYNASTNGTLYAGTEILATGTYYVSQTTNGCESTRTPVSVTVNTTPSAPALSTINQPTCSVTSGSFTINNYNSAYTYTITPSTGATQVGNTVTATTGTYILSASASGCSSGDVNFVINSILCPNDDLYTNQTAGSTAVNVGNVTSNDKLNGAAVTATNTDVTPKTEGPLSVDADGELTLAANTASGSYTLTYTICETGSNPSNCKTATATVEVVNGLVANADTYANQTAGSTAVNVGNVTSNDKLNGAAVTATNTDVTPKTEGPLSVDADGELTLAANTASGSYTLTYTICETGSNPSNCKTATATVEVVNGLVANADTYANQTTGSTAVNVGNVTSNDQLNGAAVTSTNTDVTPKTEGPLSVDADGELTLAANTASGSYTLTYTICETGSNPSNCKTATATVEVVNGLVANADSYANQTAGSTAVNVGNVTSNDQLNGAAVTATNTDVTPKTEGPLSVDADGELTLAANTASGSYTLTYTICETGSNPSNCKTATATVEVVNGLVANADSYANQTAGSTAVNVGNVTSNDQLNGAAVTATNTDVTPKTEGPLSVDADGELTLAANTASGSYTLTYTICETGSNPSNCKTATATVEVVNGLVANADSYANQTAGSTAVNVGNVTSNDQLNGAAVTATNTDVTPKTEGPLSVDADGELTLAANTASGSYTLTYTICETGSNPSNCKTATATVEVVNGLVANADTYANQTTGSTAVNVGNVTSNDKLNGAAVTATNTDVTPKTEGPLSVDADGELTLAANTASGSYTLTYTICETGSNPSNCKTATATVEVVNGLVANADTYANQTTGSTAVNVGNVTSNDKLNGAAVTATNTDVTPKTEGPLSVDADGELTLAANTASGSYTLTYTICETGSNPSNCKTATATVEVVNGLVANADTYANQTTGSTAVNVGNVTSNDKLNGAAVTNTNTDVTPKTEGPLSVDADGELTLAANTASGSYTLTYTICETGSNPSNCKTATATVEVVNGLVANADSYANQTAGSTAVNVGNVTSNDKLNGAAVTATNTDVTPKTEGPLSVDADGELTLAANTASGSYTLTYTICETGSNPSNCKTATATVEVVNGLVANADTYANQTTGSTAVNVGNVTSNDKLNGAAVTNTNTDVTPKTEGPLSVDADGELTLAANTASGSYTLTYTICETGSNPSNCKTATATVEVVNGLVANADTYANQTAGSTAVNVGNVTSNDKLNGAAVTATNTDVTPKTEGPLSVDADGELTLAANTASGSYTLTYTICETGSNPSNCKTATATVEVVNGLVANADTYANQTTGSTAVNVGNVTSNDKLNGAAVTATNTDVTPKTEGPLSVDADGELTLAANTASGSYTLTYTICETGSNPSNCKTATATVEVVNGLVANADTYANQTTGSTAVNVGNVTSNDKLNGAAVTATNTDVTPKTEGPLSVDADGELTLAANTASGSYTLTYTICETGSNPSNCKTATATVEVVNGLVANADTYANQTTGSTAVNVGNVTSNDKLNGAAVTATNTDVTPKTEGPLSVDADGELTLAANTASGSYTLTYTICETGSNPSNCKTATATVEVKNVIKALVDNISSINGNVGGTTTVSLVDNDTLNGNNIVIGTNPGNVTINIVGTLPVGLTLNANGTITVAPNTPADNYNLQYTICEVGSNPSNCDSVTIVVPVTAGSLVANQDVIPSVSGSNTPQTLGVNVFENDTKNGQKLNPSDVTVKTLTADPKGYLVLNPDGTLTLGANPPAGVYELTYEICEKLNPNNCSSNTVKVIVDMPVIDAVADTVTPINGNVGGTTISLIANDKLNGNAVTVGTVKGEVTFTLIETLPSGFALNPDYTITVAPNTPAGNYNIEYRICDNTNPSNCDSVTIVVPVTAGSLVANQDVIPSAVGVNIPQTLINVFDNDTKDGNPLVPSDVNLTVTTPDPKGYLTVDTDGNVILAPNAPAGEYELTYTICEKLNASNCSSNIVKVTVTEPTMTVTANSYCSNNIPYVHYSVTPDNFTTSNLLTIKWIDSNNNVVATQTNLQLSGDIMWPGAIVDSNGNGVDWPGWVLNNGQWTQGADGFENTRNGVKMEFSLNPTVTISVGYPTATTGCNPNPTFTIKANNDEAGPVDVKKGQNASINIFENDILNGVKVNAADVTLTTTIPNPNLTLNSDGSINITANTPDGVYELTYSICEAANPSNCSLAVVKVTVVNTLDPIGPTQGVLNLINDNNISVDGINGSLEFVNVLDNDLLNGQPINPADVTVTPITTNEYFEWNADGTVNVKPNTPGGNYPLTYQVCEKANPENCSTAVLNVFVEVPAISVIKTAVFNDENKSGFANAGETITYKFTVTNTGNVALTGITINDPLPGVVVSGQAIDLAVNESNDTNFTAVYKITQEDINRGNVSNQATVQGRSVRGVVVEDQSDDASNEGDNPTVLDLNGCSIKVLNAFSPNGDAKNARFYIRGIECYPDNTVEIYNRWGVLVFGIDKYNNNDRVFVGYSNGRSTIKQTEGLPVGTYFYILKYKDSANNPHEESGYLYINK